MNETTIYAEGEMFYKNLVKIEPNQWLIPKEGVCLLAGMASSTFFKRYRKDLSFPKPVAKIKRRLFWKLKDVTFWIKQNLNTDLN